MGLLDEAIKEHLELKRRSGADPADIARAEREALGPARRGPEPLEAPTGEETVVHHEDAAEPVEAEGVLAPEEEEPGVAFDPAPPVEPGADAAAAVEPVVPAPAPEPFEEPEPELAWESAAVEYDEPVAEPEAPESAAQETVAFDAADLAEAHGRDTAPVVLPEPDFSLPEPAPEPARPDPAPGGGDEEDVLEETPDFLQETPEHDRLWFEQRPPRDFDFDN